MFLQYGTYIHADNEVSISIDRQSVQNEAGQPWAVDHTWTITGMIQAASTDAVILAYTLLENAYSRWYRNLTFFNDDLTIAHQLPNVGSLSGVKIVKPPQYPKGEGAELSTYRTYTIVATARYPAIGILNPLKSYHESLQISGGGPRRAVVECVNVQPQEQILMAFTAYRATQRGEAVGMFSYPIPPGPLFPGKEVQQDIIPGRPSWGSAKLSNGLYIEWPVSWSYEFISATPLIGKPHQWPSG